MTGGGHVFHPRKGDSGPHSRKEVSEGEGTYSNICEFLLGMKSESKPAGRDLTVSAFFHSGTPTGKLSRFFLKKLFHYYYTSCYFIIIFIGVKRILMLGKTEDRRG